MVNFEFSITQSSFSLKILQRQVNRLDLTPAGLFADPCSNNKGIGFTHLLGYLGLIFLFQGILKGAFLKEQSNASVDLGVELILSWLMEC